MDLLPAETGNTLPVNSPAQALAISPEALEIANSFLELQSITAASTVLGIPLDQVSEVLDRREVKAYIDSIFLDLGYNNRFRISNVMDAVITKKLQEMDEADIGSGKDIADLIALRHKMTMEVLDKQIALEKAKNGGPKVKTQINVQNNEFGGEPNSKYGALMQQLFNQTK